MALSLSSAQNFYQSKSLQSQLLQAGLLLVVIVLFGWFLIWPRYQAWQESKQALAATQTELDSLEHDESVINKLSQTLQQSGSSVRLLDEALPLESRISRAHVLIAQVAQNSGLQLASIGLDGSNTGIAAADPLTKTGPYGVTRSLQTTVLSVALTGTVPQFQSFLEGLQSNGRLVDLQNLEVRTADTKVQFRIKVQLYTYAPQSQETK
jgi:Tfp pilus assembly protein PilO